MPPQPPMNPVPVDPTEQTQQTFDRLSSVASTTECTGLVPAGLEADAEAEALDELAGTYAVRPPNDVFQEKPPQ